MPNFILLTGAGFSRNWGGWVASEALAYLLGCRLDEEIRNLLWEDGQFESALAKLQALAKGGGSADKERLRTFEDAVVRMFRDMNVGFGKATFEFERGESTVRKFVSKFGTIFTLNQDNLLEGHYFQNAYVDGWAGVQVPGLKRVAAAGGYSQAFTEDWQLDDQKNWKLFPKHQRYFKLHGSSTWLNESGSRLLVLGGNKDDAIREQPLLNWYWREFGTALSKADTRLMIVGYGFNDEHVNRALFDALRAGGLQIFLFDPDGIELLRTKSPKPHLYAEAKLRLIGASRRPFSTVFGGDHIELQKVMRFFDN